MGLAHTAMGISYERYAKLNFARGDFDEMNSNLSAGFAASAIAAALFALGSVAMALFARQFFGLPAELVGVARHVFLLIGLTTALLILTGVWETPAFVTERLYLPELGTLVCTVAAAVGAVLAFEYWRPSIVLWVLLSNGLFVVWRVLVMMPMARRILPAFRVGFSLVRSSRQLRELLHFGGLNFLGGVGFLLYYASDSIIISNLPELGPGRIVHYNLAQRWDPQIRMLVMAFVGTLLPSMTSMVSLREHGRLRALFLRGTRYSLLIGIFPSIALAVYAVPFLRQWVGGEFPAISAPVLQLVMVQLVLCLPERMSYNVNIAFGRLGGPVVAALIGGVLNIVLCIALVRYAGLGLAGVAAGSAVSLLLVSFYSVYYALRLLEMPWSVWLRQGCVRALLCGIPPLATALLLRAVWEPTSLLLVFVHFAIAGLVFLAGAWAVGLEAEERRQVLDLLRRFAARRPGSAARA